MRPVTANLSACTTAPSLRLRSAANALSASSSSFGANVGSSAHRAAGLTCASCHLPRVEWRDEDTGEKRVLVQHNQNETLEPSEKMIRPVCLHCHGLGYSIDALAGRKVSSLDMVKKRFLDRERSGK